MRLLAAMSGGVDSAVAAARAVAAGHDVTGVHLALSQSPSTLRTGARGCCTVEDAHDARRVADRLGIPFYVWDFAERFKEDVIDDFVAELGFDAVVTGHHARLENGRLYRSVDIAKDQSYVLAVLSADQLAHAVFPLGDSTKEQVRAEAAAHGLAVAAKPDSHDICFIADGDTRGFLERRLGDAPGDIVDSDTGRVIGTHTGAFAFTVGQRRGLNLNHGDGEARYVLSLSPKSNTVTVGRGPALDINEVVGDNAVWTSGQAPPEGRYDVQLRAHGPTSAATVQIHDDTMVALLDGTQRGIAAGQAIVLYAGDEVLGSATITAAHRTHTSADTSADLRPR